MNVIDWKILNCGISDELLNGFILYGASSTGERLVLLLNELGMSGKILAVTDSDEKKWGQEWMGYTIVSPYEINNIQDDALIVIASVYLDEILKYLQDVLKCKNKVCSSFSLQHAFHYELMGNKPDCFKTDIVMKYRKKYELWKDNLETRNSIIQQKEYFEMVKCIMENPVSILLCGIQKTGNTSLMKSFGEKNILNTAIAKHTNIVITRHALYFSGHTLKNLKEKLYNFNNNEIKIISGVREPVERVISQIWEHISIPFLYNDVFVPDVLSMEDRHFITGLLQYEKNGGIEYDCTSSFYMDIADWFKDHIGEVFGINIFDYAFDKEKGYSIIKKNNISIFIYRLDKLDKLEKEIEEFTGKKSFSLKKENIASNKRYIFAYREYLKHIKIEKGFFNKLTNSKGMTHFYTEEECKNYRNKWQDKII